MESMLNGQMVFLTIRKLNKMAAIVFGLRMAVSLDRFIYSRDPKSGRVGFRMDSVFERSVFEPPLYSIFTLFR